MSMRFVLEIEIPGDTTTRFAFELVCLHATSPVAFDNHPVPL